MKKRIALLYGGAGSEHDVSLLGYEYVAQLLQGTDYEILPVYISPEGKWFLDFGGEKVCAKLTANLDGSLYTGLGFVKIDGAIPLLHGEGGEDGSLQGALETAGIPYVGADCVTSAVCIDKVYTKLIAGALGIPTVEGVSFSRKIGAREALGVCKERLDFPMFIKPRRLGSSVGAFPILSEDDFINLFPIAMEKGKNLVTVERMLTKKREIECAFLEMDGQRRVCAPGEILIDGFYGYGEKYGGKTKTASVAKLDKHTKELILEYALLLSDELNLRHLARIDFFLTDEGLYFNEINTFPGFTKESLYPKMLEAEGISARDALISFIEDALSC